MKKLAAMILSAALVLSMVSCSESEAGTNLPVVSQQSDRSVPAPDSSKGDPDTSKPDPDTSKPDPDSSRDDRLTPAITEAEFIIKSDYNDFTYHSQAEDYDNRTMIRKYYEGEIKDDLYRKGIFEKLTAILKNGPLKLEGEQSVSGGADSLLTMKTKSGEEYRICKGILTAHPMEEGGPEVLIFQAPHSTCYFDPDYENRTTLESLVISGVTTDENLVKTVFPQETPVKKGKSVQPDNPIAFITLRSNYAWGQEFHGSCVDTAGRMYTFDYSKVAEGTYSGTFEERLLQLIKQNGVIASDIIVDRTQLRQAIACAKKADPNGKFKEEYKMCDYGQDSLYAVVDGKAFLLQSTGDCDKTPLDKNAQEAVKYYAAACSGATCPADNEKDRVCE